MRRLAIATLSVVVMGALFAPYIAPFDPTRQLDITALVNGAPSAAHLLGTDAYSRDILSRVLFGARVSLTVAFLASLVAIVLGSLWGGLAAMLGARIASGMMVFVDTVRSVPRILLFLVAVTLVGTLTPVMLALLLGAAAWPTISRLVYTLVRDLRSREFVEAAQSVGASPARVFLQHLAPHTVGPIAASAALLVADCLAVESGLSFLGLGVRPPAPSWGNMVQDALPALSSAWWVAAVPCACLLVTVLAAANIVDDVHAQKIQLHSGRAR
ncbi:MAG: ABC transporter permease [Gemmatimonadota bacterium]|nr:ABC transporter permease [Gemmatimonadota bacterium]